MDKNTSDVDYLSYSAETLEKTFLDTRHELTLMRIALLMKGYWVDAKYQIEPVKDLEDTHIAAILKMLKNKAILKAKRYAGLEEKTWSDIIVDEPSYKSLFTEAQDRNLPGISRFPRP